MVWMIAKKRFITQEGCQRPGQRFNTPDERRAQFLESKGLAEREDVGDGSGLQWGSWSGQTAVVIAGGPSLTQEDVDACRGLRVIVVNDGYRIAPWADVLYACDLKWWRVHADASSGFRGLRVTRDRQAAAQYGLAHVTSRADPGLSKAPGVINEGGNSGHQAVNLAYLLGARRIILLGFDMGRQRGGRSHWFGSHPTGLEVASPYAQWVEKFKRIADDLAREGVEVVNASRETALTCFPRATIQEAIGPLPDVFVKGMHGLGDNLHQRAIVRELMRASRVWLETPWPSVYHDLRGDRLKILQRGSTLRAQAKNIKQERALFDGGRPPPRARRIDVSYAPDSVRKHRGVLQAMCAQAGVPVGDFSFPVPDSWSHGLDLPSDRPVMVFRPLVERTEWGGCQARNPDAESYLEIFEAIRAGYFVVSIADIEPGREWLAHAPIRADLTLHKGELGFRELAALFRAASMVYASPGFSVILAQAIGTPVVAVMGGYERGYSFSGGMASPTLLIDPVVGCDCFKHDHKCDKRIDMRRAIQQASEFCKSNRYDVRGLPNRFFNPGELDKFLDLIAEHEPETIVEFGVHRGRNAAAALRNFPSIREYVGVDVLPGYTTAMACQRNEVPPQAGDLARGDKRFRAIVRPKGSYDLTPDDLPAADFVFIDGDHSRKGVLNDYRLARAILKPGGVILFHDDNGLPAVQVTETLEELRAEGSVITHIEGTWFAIEVRP